jgi:hypothetical protein
VIVSIWQIWLVAAIVPASSRSCSGQTAPATAQPQAKHRSRVSTRGQWDAHDIHQRSVASLLRDRLQAA